MSPPHHSCSLPIARCLICDTGGCQPFHLNWIHAYTPFLSWANLSNSATRLEAPVYPLQLEPSFHVLPLLKAPVRIPARQAEQWSRKSWGWKEDHSGGSPQRSNMDQFIKLSVVCDKRSPRCSLDSAPTRSQSEQSWFSAYFPSRQGWLDIPPFADEVC